MFKKSMFLKSSFVKNAASTMRLTVRTGERTYMSRNTCSLLSCYTWAFIREREMKTAIFFANINNGSGQSSFERANKFKVHCLVIKQKSAFMLYLIQMGLSVNTFQSHFCALNFTLPVQVTAIKRLNASSECPHL